MALSLAVDIGGTFTDLIGYDDEAHQLFQAKALSTPRDLAVGGGNRPEAYNIFFQRPKPLVPRHLTFEVDQRTSAYGEVIVPFDQEQATRVAEAVRDSGVEAIAVCFLHSYVDPTDELRMGEILRRVCPRRDITPPH